MEATGELTQSSFSQGDFFYGGDRSFSEGGLKYQFNELGFLDLQYVAISFLISIHLCQTGKNVATWSKPLGGQRILRRGDCRQFLVSSM